MNFPVPADDRTQTYQVASFGPFRLLPAEQLLETADGPVRLGSRALEILIVLVEHAGQIVSKRELISRVWPGLSIDETGLRVQLGGLRKALGDGRDGARYVTNITGRGYCFVAPVARSSVRKAVPAELPASLGHAHNLPPLLTRMVGRDEVVRSVAARLTSRRFVSIIGPGGIGKTTVAVAVAHALLGDFDGAVCLVEMSSLSDPSLVAGTVVSTLGLKVQSGDPLARLIAFLGDKRLLFVLDSCEHLIDAVAALAERIFKQALDVHILTTSREALRAEGEHVHRLVPLDCPPDDIPLTAAETLMFPAAQLFVERAAAGGSTIELGDSEAVLVGQVCRRLDGIALAIELVAGSVEAYGIHGTAGLLDDSLRLLWQGRRTALPRHQTLNASLDWSYGLLSESERSLFRGLSVFVDTFSVDAAQAVASDHESDSGKVLEVLGSLVAKSLVAAIPVARYHPRLCAHQAD